MLSPPSSNPYQGFMNSIDCDLVIVGGGLAGGLAALALAASAVIWPPGVAERVAEVLRRVGGRRLKEAG